MGTLLNSSERPFIFAPRQAHQSFSQVSLDGITYDLDPSNSGWESLLATIPDTQQRAFIAGAPFASPSYKIVDNMVRLRGVVKRLVTNTDAPAFAPVVGVLPQSHRPLRDANFPSLALSGIQLNHVTVSASGQVRVLFDASQDFISLEGIAFQHWSGDFAMDSWQFSTNDDENVQLVSVTAGRHLLLRVLYYLTDDSLHRATKPSV